MTLYKETTIYDIAKCLNISPSTVSRGLTDHYAISESTKSKIINTANAMGYRSNIFASNLKRNRTDTIGLILPKLDSLMSNIVAAMEQVINENGYTLIISQSLQNKRTEIKNIKNMYNKRVDGLLVATTDNSADISHFDLFTKRGIPVLFFDRISALKNCSSVVIDHELGAYRVTQHLIGQGCKKILHITGNLLVNIYAERMKGYKRALAEHNIPFNEDLIIINNLSEQAGIETAGQILDMDPAPDAVFASSDSCAIACMYELKKKGILVPADIAFVGFNNDAMSGVAVPGLTTVNYPDSEMGKVSARNLLARLKGNSHQQSFTPVITLKPDLIIRGSSLINTNGISTA